MFFAKPGKYEPCGLYTKGHLVLLIITVVLVSLAVTLTKTCDKTKIKKIIITSSIIIWILEIIKISVNICFGNSYNPNTYIPLYYCSILLYATLFSSFGKGKIKKCGDVFIETGGIIGGVVFLLFPTTSLPEYPAFHFFSVHSFLYHGIMVYLGIVLNKSEYQPLNVKDVGYNVILVGLVSIDAYILNVNLGSNLMFISRPLPNTPLTTIYNITGDLYGIFMFLIQAVLPFYAVYGCIKIYNLVLKSINKKLFSY